MSGRALFSSSDIPFSSAATSLTVQFSMSLKMFFGPRFLPGREARYSNENKVNDEVVDGARN